MPHPMRRARLLEPRTRPTGSTLPSMRLRTFQTWMSRKAAAPRLGFPGEAQLQVRGPLPRLTRPSETQGARTRYRAAATGMVLADFKGRIQGSRRNVHRWRLMPADTARLRPIVPARQGGTA